MNGFIKIAQELAEFDEIIKEIKGGKTPALITGAADSVRTHLIFCVCETLKRPPLVITADMAHAKEIYEDLCFFYGEDVLLFPERELMFYDIEAAGADVKKKRLEVIDALRTKEKPCPVVLTAEALRSATVSQKIYSDNVLTLHVGDEIELCDLAARMVRLGYKREDMVEGAGQFSIRGGIFDFFPFYSDLAYRIEFFDTEIDSIRAFHTETQRTASNGQLSEARITPAGEMLLSESGEKRLLAALGGIVADLGKKKKLSEAEQKMAATIRRDIEKIESGERLLSADKYIPLLYNEKIPTLLDLLPGGYLPFVIDPVRVSEASRSADALMREKCADLLERGIVPASSMRYSEEIGAVLKRLEKMGMTALSPLSVTGLDFRPKSIAAITAKSLGSFNGKMEFFYDALRFYRSNSYRTVILAGSVKRAENLYNQLTDEGVPCTLSQSFESLPAAGAITVCGGTVNRGFEYPLIRTAVISDKEIFASAKKRRKRFKVEKKNKIDSFTDLSVGDYVVHQSHGIGRYLGIERLTVEGVSRDYLRLEYRGGDSLYVPAEQLDMLYKYTGAQEKSVRLNKLGGQEWNKTKQRVKASCSDMAKKLLELYAQREALSGIGFMPDTEWQRDFEAAFPYEETDDQLRCIAEVKQDMEKKRPMDRLLCGDVGYGKTEVAMRASFKAVMSGYQVVYLVPTTILANQHYVNFKQRMKDYPISIAMFSRFCTRAQQSETLKGLKTGEVDIVIGTHKLLGSSVKYKKPGLLIIDEEQRFGVAHKERIKELKQEIDVLTLSATPIPRTLHMSLSGIRDMSVIEEPPAERYPVATYVMEYDRDIVREAIKKELMRGGQVYYLHNRVGGIETVAAEISQMVPEARVETAHGQMSERELEDIMSSVSEGEIDVLVCTTIIETGLDIANVNTIIIEDADRLGLAQLYQLRGRVGRSNRLAYAYLTFRRSKVLSEDAEKRLRAIKEFTEFGSGFKIAMRDLEIRGTGNVIGPQQSGHMESVGYEMYCKLLSDAVSQLKGGEVRSEGEASVSLPVSAYIPEEYITKPSSRLDAYKMIAAIETEVDSADVYDELLDRYGDVPKVTENLMNIALIKSAAGKKRFTEVKGTLSELRLFFSPENAPDMDSLVKLIPDMKGALAIQNGTKPYIRYKLSEEKNQTLYLKQIAGFIEKL